MYREGGSTGLGNFPRFYHFFTPSLNIARWQSLGLTAPNALPRDGTAGGDGWLDHHVLGENSPKRVLGPRTKIAPRLGRDVESLQFDRHQQPREGRSPDGADRWLTTLLTLF